jgi:hypothetical protein
MKANGGEDERLCEREAGEGEKVGGQPARPWTPASSNS